MSRWSVKRTPQAALVLHLPGARARRCPEAVAHDSEAVGCCCATARQIVSIPVKDVDQDGAIDARPIHLREQVFVAQGDGKVGPVFHPFAPWAFGGVGGPNMRLRIDDDNVARSSVGDYGET